MDSFRKWKKNNDRKREREKLFQSLQSTEKMLARRRDEYAEKAKNALKEGNRAQYAAYVALLKNAMFNLAQAQDMTANFIIARDTAEMQEISGRFVKAVDGMMKDAYKTSRSINIARSQKVFAKALDKQSYTAKSLQKLLESNNIAFSSTVAELSDIGDDEVRAILEKEIQKDNGDFEESLKKLETEFAVSRTPAAPAAETVKAPAMPPAPAHGLTPAQNSPVQPDAPAPNSAPAPQTKTAAPATMSEGDPFESAFAPLPPKASSPAREGNAPAAGKPHKNFDVDNIAFRPTRLEDYIGQPNAVATVSDPIKKARLTGKALPHILICGSYGQGKTTLAKIIANEMKGNFITISAGIKQREMLKTLRELKPNDIIFIDEVHKLATEVIETLLYPAMEDYEVHYTEMKGGKVMTRSEKIAPFTLIGATTESGKLLKPFYSKFPINVTLVDYDLGTIAAIVKNSFRISHINISDELAYAVAKRSRLSPRMANAYVNGIGALAIVREAERRNLPDGSLRSEETVRALNITITEKDVNDYFERLGIDELGLKEEERKILRVIIEMYGGGPVGQENIAKALNMASNRIDQEYEPLLVKLGFVNVRPQGRFATDAAYRYLGYPPEYRGTEHGANEEGTAPEEGDATSDVPPMPAEEPYVAPQEEKDPAQEEEELPVLECDAGQFDERAAARILALFEGTARPVEQTLDELFPGAEKQYESAAKNKCILRVSGGREIYCDSALERRFLKLLFEKGFITDARSEAIELEYASGRMDGKRYYPDFVLKLYDGRVAVVEMKNLSSMGYHLNLDKYECLAAFCKEQGYLYAEIAKDSLTKKYVSAAQLKAMPANEELAAFVRGKIGENGICTGADLDAFGYGVRELMSLLLCDRSLKNIDRTGADPKIVGADE